MLNWVFALFCADSLIHVISCAAGKQRLRHITKVLLMPLLAMAYITLCRRLSPIVIAGLALGWIGDIMLLRPGVKRFQMLGIGAFLLGHICYIAAMCVEFELSARFLPWACTAVLFAGISAVIYAVLWNKIAQDMRAAGIGYFVMITALAVVSGMTVLSGCGQGICLLTGSVLFIISDSVLCYQTFTVGSPAPKFDFTVMLTYILAQSCIIAGFCM